MNGDEFQKRMLEHCSWCEARKGLVKVCDICGFICVNDVPGFK